MPAEVGDFIDESDDMGPELGPLYKELSNELVWLCWRWNQYVILYGGSQSRIDLLNSSAPFFFYVIQGTLWHETLLGIARLAGPVKTGGKANLSIHRIAPLLNDPQVKEEVAELLTAVTAHCEFAIQWRNRHIAHRDLDLALGREAKPLPGATQAAVDKAIDSLADVLNRVQRHHENSTTAYRFGAVAEDAESLLYVIRDGLRREEFRRERLQGGEYDPKDWNDDLGPI